MSEQHLEQRIHQLEAELAALRKKIEPPKVVTVEEEGTRILRPVVRLDGLPDERQSRALWQIVRAR